MIHVINIYVEGRDLTFRPSSNRAPLEYQVLTAKTVLLVGDHARIGHVGEFTPDGLLLAARGRMWRLRLYADYTRHITEGATKDDARRKGTTRGKGDVRKVRTRAHGRARSAGILGRIEEARVQDGAPRPPGRQGEDQAPGAADRPA